MLEDALVQSSGYFQLELQVFNKHFLDLVELGHLQLLLLHQHDAAVVRKRDQLYLVALSQLVLHDDLQVVIVYLFFAFSEAVGAIVVVGHVEVPEQQWVQIGRMDVVQQQLGLSVSHPLQEKRFVLRGVTER